MKNGATFISVLSVKRKNTLQVESLLIEDVVNVYMLNQQRLILYSIKLNSGLIKLLKWLMIFLQVKKKQVVFG
ncbi:MAG: hypothetical protein ACI9U0_001828 [Flavobacteriales bacterium]|jgi:hypothetical protein